MPDSRKPNPCCYTPDALAAGAKVLSEAADRPHDELAEWRTRYAYLAATSEFAPLVAMIDANLKGLKKLQGRRRRAG